MTTDAPRKAVFNTTELLENILLHLPIRSILTAQRVCRQFKELVDTSIHLQTALWMRTKNVEQTWFHQVTFASQPGPGIFLGVTRNQAFTAKDPTSPWMKHTELIPAELNPALLRSFELPEEDAAQRLGDGEYAQFLSPKDLANKQGSWRKMYLTDPACKSIEGLLRGLLPGRPSCCVWGHRKRVSDSKGLTLGAIVDHMLTTTGGSVVVGSGGNHRRFDDAVLGQAILHEERESGRKARLVLNSDIYFPGMIIPSENEWKNMAKHGSTVALVVVDQSIKMPKS